MASAATGWPSASGSLVAILYAEPEDVYDEWQQYSLRSREAFIAGVGEGFSWANSEAREAGHPIYCAPPSFSLTSGQYLALLDGYAKRKVALGSLDQQVGLLMLSALKEAYPCNQP